MPPMPAPNTNIIFHRINWKIAVMPEKKWSLINKLLWRIIILIFLLPNQTMKKTIPKQNKNLYSLCLKRSPVSAFLCCRSGFLLTFELANVLIASLKSSCIVMSSSSMASTSRLMSLSYCWAVCRMFFWSFSDMKMIFLQNSILLEYNYCKYWVQCRRL